MGLGLAFHNAASGLQANSRAVQSGQIGSGVRVTGVTRQSDPALAGLLRQSGAATQATQTIASFWDQIETALGTPGQAGSLSDLSARFTSALTQAAARPDLDNRLLATQSAAETLVTRLNQFQQVVQSQRQAAENAIAREVTAFNTGLAQVARLNDDILRLQGAGQDVLALMDQRDAVIEGLSQIIPLQVFLQQDGRVGLYSTQGAMLLDHRPGQLGFTPKPDISAGDSLQGGQLGALTLNGLPLPSGPDGPLGGGRLGALFALRDSHAPQAQAHLDQIALDLAQRLTAPGVDPSQPPGSAGLITDAGAPVDALNSTGLAGRLRLNPDLTSLSQWRDGLYAPSGPEGHADQLQRWIAALESPDTAGRSHSESLGTMLALVSQTRQQAEDSAITDQIRHQALDDTRRAQGVNTDEQMQRLLLIEKAYAANARVMQIVDDLFRRLMEI